VHDFNLYDVVFVISRAILRAPTTNHKFLEHTPLGPFILNEDFCNGSHFFPYQIPSGSTDVTFLFYYSVRCDQPRDLVVRVSAY